MPFPFFTRVIATVSPLLAVLALAAHANDGKSTCSACTPQKNPSSWLDGDSLTGDWGGLRPQLEDKGVQFTLEYTHEYLANVSGGIRRGGQYNGLIVAGIELDLEKLTNGFWKGGLIHADGLYTLGESLSEHQVGDEGNVSNINFRNSIRLFEAWIEQSFALPGDGKVSIRAGQLALDSDFAGSDINDDLPGGSLFIYGDFGAMPIFSFNVPVPIFAISAPGVMLRVEPSKNFYFQTALYDGNPSPGDFGDPSPDANVHAPKNDHNVRWRLAADEGFLWVSEVGFLLNPAEAPETPSVESLSAHGSTYASNASSAQAATNEAATTVADGKSAKETVAPEPGLPGVYKLGFFYHSDEFTDWKNTSPGFERDGDYGFYAVASQMVWREQENQGLAVFVRGSYAPEDRNVIDYGIDGGLVYKGLIPGRDDDDFGVACSYKHYSNDFSAAEVAAGSDERSHEAIIEATYSAKVTGWMSVQPVVQYITKPSGIPTSSDAWVIGVRSAITF